MDTARLGDNNFMIAATWTAIKEDRFELNMLETHFFPTISIIALGDINNKK